MRLNPKKIAVNLLKLAIAVGGVWWVVAHMHWNDTATVAAHSRVRQWIFVHDTDVRVLPDEPGQPPNTVHIDFGTREIELEDADSHEHKTAPINSSKPFEIDNPITLPNADFKPVPGQAVPVMRGLKDVLSNVRNGWWLLVVAWAILVSTFVATAWRWKLLMQPQGIFLPYSKCLALTFVGQFYSTFLPGITGGDLVKIIYTSKVTGDKTKSTITILLDRVIGLVALMVIAGVSAGFQMTDNTTMRNIFLLVVAGLLAMAVGCAVYFSHRLRRLSGLSKLLGQPFVPEFVRKADDTLHAYRGHSGIIAVAFGVSLLVQLTLPISVWLSGIAFGVHDVQVGYYLAYVPVAVLASSLPFSPPQGAGLSEYIIGHFFSDKPVAALGHPLTDAAHAFALTQAVRFLPILWNMLGAYWVVRGDYSRHQAEDG